MKWTSLTSASFPFLGMGAKYFEQILSEVDLNNIMHQHLDKIMDNGMVERSKKPEKGH